MHVKRPKSLRKNKMAKEKKKETAFLSQSRYFDCDYDEHEKGDGGLSAGAPVFLSEVIHGTACNLL